MNVFYNPDGVGDILIIPIGNENENFTYEQYGDVTRITDAEGNILGYNIFNASKHFTIEESGTILLTEPLLNKIKKLFENVNLQDPLEFDLTPKFVIGYVVSKEQHENADKLSVCQVDVGKEILQIVCGATNVDKGQKVVVAKVGATMPSGLEIKPTELRGVASNGMICSREELGLLNPNNEKGIYILNGNHEIGEPFLF